MRSIFVYMNVLFLAGLANLEADEFAVRSSIAFDPIETIPAQIKPSLEPEAESHSEASTNPGILVPYQSDSIRYQRLFFEESKLERQGESKTPPLQLAASSVRFFTQSIVFPLNILLGRHRAEQP